MTRWMAPATGVMLSLGAAAGATQNPPPDLGLRADAEQAVAACIPPGMRDRPLNSVTAAEQRRLVACVNVAVARQLRSQLPVKVDEITWLERISTSGPMLTYHYRITRLRQELSASDIAALERSTRTNVCQTRNMVSTMRMGGSYGYRWVDSRGRPIHQIRIDGC